MIYYTLAMIFILGLIIGSFINCLIWRIHEEESILGRSYCPKCKNQIAWHDNIPVLSFLFLKGKCRHCHEKISWQYPVTELITGLLFLLAFLFEVESFSKLSSNSQFLIFNFQSIFNFEFLVTLFRDLFFIPIMIIIFIYDLRWYMILDRVTLPSILIIFILNLFLGFDFWNLLLGIFAGAAFFAIQFIVSKGRWIGGGDIRLGALMGAMFSWPMVLLAIFLAYLIGSIISIVLVVSGKKEWGSEVPLGIFLTTSSVLVLFWGKEILNWYLNLL